MKKHVTKAAKKHVAPARKATVRRPAKVKLKINVNQKKLDALNVGTVPLRTTARVFAQNQAELLGVKLSKPGLRKATDRVEKLFKAKGIGGSALKMAEPVLSRPEQGQVPIAPIQTAADEQATKLRQEAMLREAQTSRPNVDQSRFTDPPRVAGASLGSAVRANEARTSAPPAARRPMEMAVEHLDQATSHLFESMGALSAQLVPLLPPEFDMAIPSLPVNGFAAPVPNFIDGVASRLDAVRLLVNNLRDALAV